MWRAHRAGCMLRRFRTSCVARLGSRCPRRHDGPRAARSRCSYKVAHPARRILDGREPADGCLARYFIVRNKDSAYALSSETLGRLKDETTPSRCSVASIVAHFIGPPLSASNTQPVRSRPGVSRRIFPVLGARLEVVGGPPLAIKESRTYVWHRNCSLSQPCQACGSLSRSQPALAAHPRAPKRGSQICRPRRSSDPVEVWVSTTTPMSTASSSRRR